MARRRKGKKKGKTSIALLPLMPVAYVGYNAYKSASSLGGAINSFLGQTIGYYPSQGTFSVDNAKMFWFGETVAIIGHKVANKVGINKGLRALTGGWLSL